MILKRHSQQKPPLTSWDSGPAASTSLTRWSESTTHQQGTQKGTGCRHLTGSKQHTPQPRGRPMEVPTRWKGFCSAWGILQTRKEMRKGLGYTTVDNDNGGFQSWKLCTSYGDKQKRAIDEGDLKSRLIKMSPVICMYFSLPHIGYWGSFVSIKSSKIPQIHEPANF